MDEMRQTEGRCREGAWFGLRVQKACAGARRRVRWHRQHTFVLRPPVPRHPANPTPHQITHTATLLTVRRVDELVRHRQRHRLLRVPRHVAAPPAVLARLHARVALDALDEDQEARVGVEHAAAEALGGELPVGGDAAVAPRGAAVGLVVEVCFGLGWVVVGVEGLCCSRLKSQGVVVLRPSASLLPRRTRHPHTLQFTAPCPLPTHRSPHPPRRRSSSPCSAARSSASRAAPPPRGTRRRTRAVFMYVCMYVYMYMVYVYVYVHACIGAALSRTWLGRWLCARAAGGGALRSAPHSTRWRAHTHAHAHALNNKQPRTAPPITTTHHPPPAITSGMSLAAARRCMSSITSSPRLAHSLIKLCWMVVVWWVSCCFGVDGVVLCCWCCSGTRRRPSKTTAHRPPPLPLRPLTGP